MGWLIALWIVGGLALVVTLLVHLPVGVCVKYNQDGLKMWYVIGPIWLLNYPEKKKKKSKITLRSILEDPKSTAMANNSVLGDFWYDLRTTLDLLWSLRQKLRIKRLQLRVILAGDDPSAVAMQYGYAWSAIGMLFPLLEEAFVVKKRDIQVRCDFEAKNTVVDARLDIKIGLGKLIARLVRYSLDHMPEQPNTIGKAVTDNEPKSSENA